MYAMTNGLVHGKRSVAIHAFFALPHITQRTFAVIEAQNFLIPILRLDDAERVSTHCCREQRWHSTTSR